MVQAVQEIHEPRQAEFRMIEAYRSFAIHQTVTQRPKGDAKLRRTVRSVPQLNSLDSSTKNALLRVAGRAKNASYSSLLVKYAADESFTSLSVKMQRRILELLRSGGDDLQLVRFLNNRRFAQAFRELKDGIQAKVIVEVGRARTQAMFQAITAILSHPFFAAMDDLEKNDLLRFLGGPNLPKHLSEQRKSFLQGAWDKQRLQLVALLQSPKSKRMDPEEMVDLVWDQMHAPTNAIFLLVSRGFNNHQLITFGDPADPKSLSYGRRLTVRNRKIIEDNLSCPDRAVSSAWQEPICCTKAAYSFRRYTISAYDQQSLITYLEGNFAFSFAEESNLYFGPCVSPLKPAMFLPSVGTAVKKILGEQEEAARETGAMVAGKPDDKAGVDAECESLLEDLFAA